MALESIFPSQVHIEPTVGSGSRLTLPKRRAPLALVPTIVLLWVWLSITPDVFIGPHSLVNGLLRALRPESLNLTALVFLGIWVAGWTFFSLGVLALLAWLLAGRERVWVERGVLTVEQVVGSWGRRRCYDLHQVTGLRVLSRTRDEQAKGLMMTPFGLGRYGSLVFNYGSRTVWWGGGLDESEARAVAEWVREQGVSRTVQPAHTLAQTRTRTVPWRQWLAWLIAVPFGVAVVVHLLTFVGIRIPEGTGDAIPLGLIPALVAFAGMVFDSTFVSTESVPLTDRKSTPWVGYIAIGLFFYAMVNFFLCGQLMEWAGPASHTAMGYFLTSHGKIIRPLTEAEYWRMRAYEIRLATGGIMMFLGWPVLYFFSVDHRPTQTDARTFQSA